LDDVELQIDKVVANGAGLGRLDDGTVVFCDGALPGERIAVEIVERHRDFARAQLLEVVVAGPDRVTPPCPHIARGCGGCTWQYVAVDAQPRLKAEIVADALRRLAHMPDVQVSVSPNPVGFDAYRTTLALAVNKTGHPAFRRRGTHESVVVDSCLVSHPRLVELLAESRFPGAKEVVLRVSAATGERVAAPDRPGRGVTVPKGTKVSTPKHPASIHEDVAGRRWQVSARSFFQPGPGPAAVLVDAVERAAGAIEGCVLVDLYAGVGLLGGALAADGKATRLVAVESHPTAAQDAQINLADLDARVYAADVADAAIGRADVVVADPSRPGLGRPGTEAVARTGASTVVLVSCDPASMARDAGLLVGGGYGLESVEVVDLFPGTFHVETVSKFTRAG
jgi:23S rRNA (uracil1939-C5)-methyltransferase